MKGIDLYSFGKWIVKSNMIKNYLFQMNIFRYLSTFVNFHLTDNNSIWRQICLIGREFCVPWVPWVTFLVDGAKVIISKMSVEVKYSRVNEELG